MESRITQSKSRPKNERFRLNIGNGRIVCYVSTRALAVQLKKKMKNIEL